jgi:hypothetical protein
MKDGYSWLNSIHYDVVDDVGDDVGMASMRVITLQL